MQSGLIGINIKGNIIHLNRSACRILDLEADTIDPSSYKETLRNFDFLLSTLDRVVNERLPVDQLEHRMLQKSGDEVILGISGSPVHDHNDRLVGAILLINNLTEVRRLQMEIAFKEKIGGSGRDERGAGA